MKNYKPKAGNAVVDQEEYEINVATDPNNGSFTGGNIKIFRVGKMVTLHFTSFVHASSASVVSSVGMIPERFRPYTPAWNVYYYAGSVIFRVGVTVDGRISTRYYNSTTGADSNQVGSGDGVISYAVA